LNRHDKRAPEDMDDDGESHAADEPTAVWDESALRAAGLSDLLNKRKSDPPPPPATPSSLPDRPSIELSEEVARAAMEAPVPPAAPLPPEPQQVLASAPPPGLGWGTTLALAIVLGGLVYALIRYLKG
jgi:hypothetical protein